MSGASGRGVIAVIADAFSPFHREVLDGLSPHFQAAGYGTLAVTGRDVRTDRVSLASSDDGPLDENSNRLDVRGVVVVCGATPPELTDDEVGDYVKRFADGPVVSFGIKLPGVPSVFIDWDDAIADLMAHMVQAKSRKRFAFIRGFAGDPHSIVREEGFRTGLAVAGLPVDEQLIVSGHYSVADARIAIGDLLDQQHSFDGIVAANDDMALGAIAALTERGLTVPGDVIVAGFDDSAAAFRAEPPLTSVLLNTPQLTASTARLLVDAIESGVPLDDNHEIHLPSRLVVRATTFDPSSPDEADDAAALEGSTQRQRLTQVLTSRWEASRAPECLDLSDLARAAADTMLLGDSSFIEALSAFDPTNSGPCNRGGVEWLRHISDHLHALIAEPAASEIPEQGLRAMLQQLADLDRRMRPVEQFIAVERDSYVQLQERLLMRLAFCSDADADELWDVLRTGLTSLGMRHAWVASSEQGVTDDGEATPDAAAEMRLLFSLSDEGLGGGVRFPRSQILPTQLRHHLEGQTYVLVPLRAGVSDIGFLVVEPRGEFLLELEAIASGIAQVLRNVHQVEHLESQANRLQEANETLNQLSRRDSLTGLANRSAFMERLASELEDAPSEQHISILFLDLDGFKEINDTLGHGAGDYLLQVLAERFGRLVDEGDLLARLGGDEFTFLVRHDRRTSRVSDLCNAALQAASGPAVFEGSVLQVSASVGIASSPDDGQTGLELLRNADAAMYAAKAAGKNSFVYFASDVTNGENSLQG